VKSAKTISIPDITARDAGEKDERQMAAEAAAVNGGVWYLCRIIYFT